jgi:PhnB protein
MIDMKKSLPRPDGHHTITPGFIVPRASEVVTFLEKAFGGRVVDRYDAPDGKVGHVEVAIGDSVVMFGDAIHDAAMPANLSFYVTNGDAVDATYKKALSSGATSVAEPSNQFYGYRSASVRDVGGNKWTICAVVEQLSKEQIVERMKGMKS